MMRILTLSTVATLLVASALPAIANDARSIALGGATIAHGKGVHGALANPAAMMAMQRRGEKAHIRWGASAEFRDAGEIVDTLSADENENLIDDIDEEIRLIGEQPIECNPFTGNDDSVCISGTQPLSDLSGRVVGILDIIDEEQLEGFGVADLGMAYTKLDIPFAINLRFSASGSGAADIAEGDRNYISEFNTLLDGDELTLGEIKGSEYFEVNALGVPADVDQPEDTLTSSGEGAALLRTQLSLSMATTLTIAGQNLDIGVSPKFSSLKASSLYVEVREEFQDDTVSAVDRFNENEVTESSFTVDLGASMMLPNAPVQLAAVIRNLIPESIKTREGFEFETTPQFVIGANYQRGRLSVTGDMALNSAKQDNFETRKIGAGIEYGTRLLKARAGIAHDSARDTDGTSLSLGFGLGSLSIGGRVTGLEGLEVGAQLAHSFR